MDEPKQQLGNSPLAQEEILFGLQAKVEQFTWRAMWAMGSWVAGTRTAAG